MKTRGVRFGIAALWLAMAAPGSPGRAAQPQAEGQTPQPTFRAGVSLVRVDVTVTGRNDLPVDDLEAGDFDVREDGVPQRVEAFQFIRLTGEPRADDETSLDIRSREHGAALAARDDVRVFALFLDDYHISEDVSTTQRLRQALTEWIDTGLKPTDIVILMDPLMPISGIAYTRSRFDLLEHVKKFKGRRGIYVPARSVLEEGQQRARNPRRIRAEVTLSALTAIVTHLGALRERRSSVIFVSEGPPLFFSDADVEERMREVLEAANRGNVTINVLDPRGLGSRSPSDSLWRLSGETGGRAVVNTNGFADGLRKIGQDASAYYLIGYTPASREPDGKFHRIEISVRRKGVAVAARKGYWAPTAAETTPLTAAVVPPDVSRALEALVDLGRERRALTWVGADPGGLPGARLEVSWQPLDRGAANAASAPEVLVVAGRDGQGQALTELRVPSGRAGGGAQSVAFGVPPGAVSLALRLETAGGDVVDAWTEAVDVPDFATGRALGTPRLLVARSAPELRALLAQPETAIPSPLRVFRRSDRVLVRTRLPAGAGPLPAVAAALLNRQGDTLADLAVTATPDTWIRTELPMSSLAPGDYVLKVAVPERSAARHVAFRVVP